MKEKIKKLFSIPAWRTIIQWSRMAWCAVAILIVLDGTISGFSLMFTLATKKLIDAAVNHEHEEMIRSAVILGLVMLSKRLLVFLYGRIKTDASAKYERDLRESIVQDLLQKEYGPMSKYHSGEIINRMFSDVGIVKSGILEIVPNLVSIAVSFFGATWILLTIDWRMVVFVVIGGVVALGISLRVKKPFQRRHKAVQHAQDTLHAMLQEVFSNLKIIKAGSAEQYMLARVETGQKKLQKAQIERGYFSIRLNFWMSVVFHATWLFCMIWGCRNIYFGIITYGSLVAVIQLINQIQEPISSAASVLGQAYGMLTSAERLKEMTDQPNETAIPENLKEDDPTKKEFSGIEVKNLYFSYGREKVLSNISMNIQPHRCYALTGKSGNGKSTLFSLILGLYRPNEGEITVCFADGEACAPSKRTRRLFAYVPQGNMLLSGTLRENLELFCGETTQEELMEAIHLACLDGLMQTLPNGLDTELGEHGIGLSEGQGQRIAVARALLSKAPILLLDEATSALDEATEAELLQNIEKMEKRTCIIVTHRRAAMAICDYELHLEQGGITQTELDHKISDNNKND